MGTSPISSVTNELSILSLELFQRSCIRQDASGLMQGTRPRACDPVGLYNLAQSLMSKPAMQVTVRELKVNLARALSRAHSRDAWADQP